MSSRVARNLGRLPRDYVPDLSGSLSQSTISVSTLLSLLSLLLSISDHVQLSNSAERFPVSVTILGQLRYSRNGLSSVCFGTRAAGSVVHVRCSPDHHTHDRVNLCTGARTPTKNNRRSEQFIFPFARQNFYNFFFTISIDARTPS